MLKSWNKRSASCLLVIGLVSASWSASAQVVALGASVIQGYGTAPGETFPDQLQAMLRARGKNYSVSNAGVFGDTTTGVLDRLDSAVPEGTRVVVLLIGGNDVRRGRSAADAAVGVREITARLRARGIKVINAMPYYRAAKQAGMLLPSDAIHLNADGQRYMAAQVAPQIK